jgi:hypothetical protein
MVVKMHMSMRYKRPDDLPLYVTNIRRVSKGVYVIELRFESGRLFGRERFEARDMSHAMQRCKRLYPSTVYPGE